MGIPEVPAATVTVEGESDSEKLFEVEEVDVEDEEPQPESAKPTAASRRIGKMARRRRKRHPMRLAISKPKQPKEACSTRRAVVERVLFAAVERKELTFPLKELLVQLAVPV